MMKYAQIPGIDKPVSRIVQGAAMINALETDERFAVLDACLEAGINTFDSAHVYGTDANFGEWVRERGVREKIVLLDKCAHFNQWRQRVTPYDITADLHDLLAQLQFEYIDLFVMHRDDRSVPVGPIVEVMNEHIQAGLIRAYGGSNWTHERIAEANAYADEHGLVPLAVSSPHFSLGEMVREPWGDCLSIAGAGGEQARKWYAENDVALFPWSTLCGGFFSGKYDRASMTAADADTEGIPVKCYRSDDNIERLDRAWQLAAEKNVTVAQIAAAWVTHHPLNVFALICSWNIEEIQANVEALNLDLTEGEMDWLDLR